MIEKNVGSIDRTARIVLGLVLNALIGWCPAYRLLGLRTCFTGRPV